MADSEPITNIASKRIKTLLDKADSLEAGAEKSKDEANAARWEAARLMVEQLDTGKTQTALASEIGRSQSYVSRCARIWKEQGEDYAGARIEQTFNALFEVYATMPAKDRKATVDEAAATGQSAATLANQNRRRQAQEGPLTVPTGEQTLLVLKVIGESGGLTDSETEEVTGLKHQSASARRRDLQLTGWVVDSGVRRRGAKVWMLSLEGIAQYPGRLPKNKKRAPRPKTRPTNETPDERRQRLEREAIKAAEEEFKDRNSGAARFRGSLADWQRWIGGARYLHGLIDDEQYSCPPTTQEALLQTLDRFIEIATETAEALRSHQPTPVDMGYYKVLGVPTTATAAAIKKAYWELARKYHPDAQGGNDEKFKEIATANAVLSDPERRRLYNSDGKSMK